MTDEQVLNQCPKEEEPAELTVPAEEEKKVEEPAAQEELEAPPCPVSEREPEEELLAVAERAIGRCECLNEVQKQRIISGLDIAAKTVQHKLDYFKEFGTRGIYADVIAELDDTIRELQITKSIVQRVPVCKVPTGA